MALHLPEAMSGTLIASFLLVFLVGGWLVWGGDEDDE